jgi:8-oxo-dGTP pyrophosphatase MutT (NUDIX family)
MDNPVPALASATVVVLREGEKAPELLMVKRRAGDAFGDSYAFPGGVVDHDESDAHGLIDGRTADEAAAILGIDGNALDYYSAAIRELFEETGILLARTANGAWANVTDELQELRIEVDKGRLRWSAFLEQQKLRIACDALHYFAYWQTPLDQPKRWSTRFFVAAAPPGQEASHDGSEVTEFRWITAKDALAAARERLMKLPQPTKRNLKNMQHCDSVDGTLAWADNCCAEGIVKLQPILVDWQGKQRWVVWGDEGYPFDGPQ